MQDAGSWTEKGKFIFNFIRELSPAERHPSTKLPHKLHEYTGSYMQARSCSVPFTCSRTVFLLRILLRISRVDFCGGKTLFLFEFPAKYPHSSQATSVEPHKRFSHISNIIAHQQPCPPSQSHNSSLITHQPSSCI